MAWEVIWIEVAGGCDRCFFPQGEAMGTLGLHLGSRRFGGGNVLRYDGADRKPLPSRSRGQP